MRVREESLFLTPKGTEELRSRVHGLDVTARNILYLIQLGSTTAETILHRSIFPRDAVVDRLRRLLGNQFVAVAPTGKSKGGKGKGALPQAADRPDLDSAPALEQLPLEAGVSLSQARFLLSDFCLDQFGTQGTGLVDAAGLAVDVPGLQQVLNRVRIEVQSRCPDRLTLLVNCVREINKTADETASPEVADAPKASMSAEGALRLGSDISLSQARFALTDFCLNHFGIRGQDLVETLNRCGDVAALQIALTSIRDEVLNRCRDRLPALIDCVREFNETDD
jgi:hypothetical protein